MNKFNILIEEYSKDENIKKAFRDGMIQGAELNAEFNANLHNEILTKQLERKILFSEDSYFTRTIRELELEISQIKKRLGEE